MKEKIQTEIPTLKTALTSEDFPEPFCHSGRFIFNLDLGEPWWTYFPYHEDPESRGT
jgi:hypothetical protein